MFTLEPFLHERAPETFDSSGMVKEILPWTEWPRMLDLQKSDGINSFVISHEPYPDDFYRGLKKGSLVIRYGVGYDAVPVDLCRELGILVANTPGTLDQSVAEHAATLMMTAARHVVSMDASVKSGSWNQVMAKEFKGQTLAVIGFGNIGRTLASIAKFGLGMRIVAFDINERIRSSFPDLFDEFTNSFEDAVSGADFVSLHMNLNPSTAGFINTTRLKHFKSDAILINTARGGVINEKDLYSALQKRSIACAALDVFENEPYVPLPGADLRTLKNVIMTPHVASHTVEANRRMAGSCIENAKNYKQGRLSELTLIPEQRELV
jgi:D-3-phosphoglycerate dehydrogenase